MNNNISRRATLQLAAASLALGATLTANARQVVRISYQRSSVLLTLIKQNGTLEKKLAPLGFDITWQELSGNALLASLNAGSVDIHADVADAYALLTQASKAPLTYFAKETSAPTAQAVIVRSNSTIHTPADLKGKRVSTLKGAGAHYLLLVALKQFGLKSTDIDLRLLDTQDAVAAFSKGDVDALAIWDPLLALHLEGGKNRVLIDGRNGLTEYSRYYTATNAFAKANPKVLKIVFDELQATGRWVKSNPLEAAERLAPIWGTVSVGTLAQVNTRRSYAIVPVARDQLAEQQRIATVFKEAGVISQELKAADIPIWTPTPP